LKLRNSIFKKLSFVTASREGHFLNKNIKILFILISALSISLLSCRHIKPDKVTSEKKILPDNYSTIDYGTDYPDRWWLTFKNDELNRLIETAINENFSIQEAWCRLRQLYAQNAVAISNLYPDISISAEMSTYRQRSENIMTNKVGTTSNENYTIGLAGSYEVDLWGKIRSIEQSAASFAMATRQDINTAAMTIAAQVAENWINIISQNAQKNLLLEQLKNKEIILRLVKLRFKKSSASVIEVLEQERSIENLKAAIPLIESKKMLLLNELAQLLGQSPGSISEIVTNKLPTFDKIPKTGLPADLLTKRPDIQAASLRLKASQFDLITAKANRMPSIRLTANTLMGLQNLLIYLIAGS